MSRTFLFYTHFSQIRYQIKAKTPTHMAKHKELFFCLLFLKYSNFFSGEAKLFWASLSMITFCTPYFVSTKSILVKYRFQFTIVLFFPP